MNTETMQANIELIEMLSHRSDYCLSVWGDNNVAVVFLMDDQKTHKVLIHPLGGQFKLKVNKGEAIQDAVKALLKRIEAPYSQQLPDCDLGCNYNRPYG